MDKYVILYRTKEVKTIECYSIDEAKDKAKNWFVRQCKDNNKNKKEVAVRTKINTVIKVF